MDVLSSVPSLPEGMMLMSTYEKFVIILTVALLIVAILDLDIREKRVSHAVAALIKSSCKHSFFLVARAKK